MNHRVVLGENLGVLRELEDESADLIYIHPPCNTGRVQARTSLKTVRSEEGDRKGFQGRSYATTKGATRSFDDRYDDFLAFLEPRLIELHRILKPTGSFYF